MMGAEADVATPAADEASRLAVLRARLAAPMPDDRPWGWLGPLLVTAFGAWLRFYRLAVPRALIFDETYYVKDAWSILQHGVEWQYVTSPTNQNLANQLILQGHTSGLFAKCSGAGCGEYVVQPEAGKLLAWNNRLPDGGVNPATLHHAMKVRKGLKYVVTRWYRERPWGWQV